MFRRKMVGVSQVVVWVALLAFSAHGAAADGNSVSLTTDASGYAPGDAITVLLVNGTTTPIAPIGGIVCQGSLWPFGLQRLDDVGDWQDVAFPRVPPCIGIAVVLLGPGETQTKQFPASSDPGTYRVTYAYNSADGSGQGMAASDPYDVLDPAAMTQTDGTGSVSLAPAGYLEGQVAIYLSST